MPPLFPVFMAEFGLSFAQLGALMSVFFVVSGLGQASAGFVVDSEKYWSITLKDKWAISFMVDRHHIYL